MVNSSLIQVTDKAVEEMARVVSEQTDNGTLVRVIVNLGQNGDFQYQMGIDKEPDDTDLVMEFNNLKILVDKDSASLLEGAEIDYVDGLMRSGFVITNPNAQSGCGCGGGGGGCACGGGGHGGGGGGCACGGGGHGGDSGGCACGGH